MLFDRYYYHLKEQYRRVNPGLIELFILDLRENIINISRSMCRLNFSYKSDGILVYYRRSDLVRI